MPVIGWLDPSSPEGGAKFVTAFREGLSETGYVIGENVTIDHRWAEGQVERLADLAADLVRRQVAVIAAVGGSGSAVAAKSVTAIIPIVFGIGDDPIALGLVASFNQPRQHHGRELAGLEAKRLELMSWCPTPG